MLINVYKLPSVKWPFPSLSISFQVFPSTVATSSSALSVGNTWQWRRQRDGMGINCWPTADQSKNQAFTVADGQQALHPNHIVIFQTAADSGQSRRCLKLSHNLSIGHPWSPLACRYQINRFQKAWWNFQKVWREVFQAEQETSVSEEAEFHLTYPASINDSYTFCIN